MAEGRDNDKRKKAASSQPLTDETTASYTGTLTFDLMVEILSRLPVKSLMQLQCVCKSWNSLISDPKFAKKHLCLSRTQLNRHHLLLSRRDGKSSVDFPLWDTQLTPFFNSASTGIHGTRLRYPFNIQGLYAKLIASCNGILCFSIKKIPSSSVVVWNPSIRKFKILPPLPYQQHFDRTIYGFGYDCLTDTYKVAALCCYNWDSFNKVCKIQVKLHTLGKDTWKTVKGFPSRLGEGILFNEFGRFVSGTINWLVPTDSSSSRVILSLDLGNESYQEFLPPNYGEVCDLTLGVLRDCLCILAHTDTLVIHVWIMKDYGNKDSWTKLFVFPYQKLCGYQDYAYPLYISEDDELLLDFGAELAVYNSQDGTGKTHEFGSIFSDYCDWFDNHVYVESLISL